MGNIRETTTAKAGETRETAEAGEAGTELGIEIRDITAESAEATMPVVGDRQPYGLLHGGVTALLVEHTASVAAGAWAATHGMAAVGASLTIIHVRLAQFGIVRCMIQAQHLGRRTAVYVFQVVSETSEKLTPFGSVSCQLAAKNPGGASRSRVKKPTRRHNDTRDQPSKGRPGRLNHWAGRRTNPEKAPEKADTRWPTRDQEAA